MLLIQAEVGFLLFWIYKDTSLALLKQIIFWMEGRRQRIVTVHLLGKRAFTDVVIRLFGLPHIIWRIESDRSPSATWQTQWGVNIVGFLFRFAALIEMIKVFRILRIPNGMRLIMLRELREFYFSKGFKITYSYLVFYLHQRGLLVRLRHVQE